MNNRTFKNILFSFIRGCCFIGLIAPFSCRAGAPQGPMPSDPMFTLSDDELKKLNLGENETQEIKQFFEALNNLTPDQKKELEELGRQTEESMRKKNLDPANFDDLVKFMEEEGLAPQRPMGPQPPPEEQQPTAGLVPMPSFAPQPPSELAPPTKPLPIVEARSTHMLLNDLTKYLNSFKHKASLHSTYKNRLRALHRDLVELSYFLEVLKQPDLSALLGSTEFVLLYKHLEKLRTTLLTHEPLIEMSSKSSEEDNPYEVLDIPQDATPEDIEKTYQALKAAFNPQDLEAYLNKEGLNPKAIKKELTKSRLFFSFIQEAYTSLKDPKQKAFIDRDLRLKQEQERRRTSVSARSVERIIQALVEAFRSDMILQNIKQLIEKNKPQELIIARAEIEKEQKALERSKTPVKIPQLPPQPAGLPTGDKYGEFYQKMAAESFNRPQYPLRFDWAQAQNGRANQGQGGPSARGGSQEAPKKQGGGDLAAKGKKEEKKEEKDKKATKKEVAGKKSKEKKEEEEIFSKKDVERYLAIQTIQQVLEEDTKLLQALETPVEEEQEEEKSEEQVQEEAKPKKLAELPALLKDLDEELTSFGEFEGSSEKNPSARFIKLAERLNIPRLKKAADVLAPKKDEKFDDSPLKKIWSESVVKPYGKTILKLYDVFYKPIDAEERKASRPIQRHIHPRKAKKYNIEKERKKEHKDINLGALKDDISSMLEKFSKFEQAVGIKPGEKPKPAEEK